DAVVAAELVRVEQLQADVEEIRARGDTLAEWLAWAPGVLRDLNDEETSAAHDAARLDAQLQDAGDELELARLRVALEDAGRRGVRARENAEALGRERTARERDFDDLRTRAAELTPRIRGMEPPGDLAKWASQARGALLVEHSGLAREREAIVREA